MFCIAGTPIGPWGGYPRGMNIPGLFGCIICCCMSCCCWGGSLCPGIRGGGVSERPTWGIPTTGGAWAPGGIAGRGAVVMSARYSFHFPIFCRCFLISSSFLIISWRKSTFSSLSRSSGFDEESRNRFCRKKVSICRARSMNFIVVCSTSSLTSSKIKIRNQTLKQIDDLSPYLYQRQ